MKRLTFILYAIVILVMAMATIVEKFQSTGYVQQHIYGAWWFTLLWMLMAVGAAGYIVRRKVKRFSILALHASFLIILLGALLTHLTAWQGYIHLRKGEPVSMCVCVNTDGTLHKHDLPFTIQLDTFSIRYYNGTQAAADYISHFTLTDGNDSRKGMVSMNHIFTAGQLRLYQNGYDEDMQGATLAINCDPWGIPVTYLGYALLFISWLWLLIDPKGRFRKLLHRDYGSYSPYSNYKSPLIIALLLFSSTTHLSAATTLTAEQADQFGRLHVLYGDRICPLQTLAIDFTRKLYGKAHYQDYTAEQVLAGFLFYPEEWNNEPLIRIKSKAIQQQFDLPTYTSVSKLFNTDTHQYLLGPAVQEYLMGNGDKLHQDVMKLDDKLMLVMQLTHGGLLKVFPYRGNWYAPADPLPTDIETERSQYFSQALSLLGNYYRKGQTDTAHEMLVKLLKYQQTYGAADLPSATQLWAERLYNAVPFTTVLFILCLTMGFISLLRHRWIHAVSVLLLCLSFGALTVCLMLRWLISGTIPMANGYETMLTMAWIIMLTALLARRRYPIVLSFGLLLAGFFLLVSHLGQMDPQISHVMPVLSSPLLSIHVSTIMMAFALLSITAACALYGLLAKKRAAEMQHLSLLLLYPALALLSAGIFIGAIWANQSWGRYWGWDPKEVWALITLMVYAIPVHSSTFSFLRRPRPYHLYLILAFLTILMTYFGVNFLLGGMHSYA
jgi:ABC-type transport system involved in cytochrome c biogenesis permease subunit